MLEFIPVPLLIGFTFLVFSLVVLWLRKSSFCHLLFVFLFGLYLLDAIRLTVFPIPLPEGLGGIGSRSPIIEIVSRVNLIPLNFGGLFSSSPGVIYENLVGNLLLTLPFGFGIHFIAGTKTRIGVKPFLWLAILPGMAVEITQLAVSLLVGASYRGVDINDVLLNIVGAWIGYALFQIFTWAYLAFARRFAIRPGGILAFIYAIISR